MAIDPSRVDPSFQLSGVTLISGAGAPTNGTTLIGTKTGIYTNTSGSSGSTRAYITLDSGATWIAVTTAS